MIYTTCNNQSDCSISFSYSINIYIYIYIVIIVLYFPELQSQSSYVLTRISTSYYIHSLYNCKIGAEEVKLLSAGMEMLVHLQELK